MQTCFGQIEHCLRGLCSVSQNNTSNTHSQYYEKGFHVVSAADVIIVMTSVDILTLCTMIQHSTHTGDIRVFYTDVIRVNWQQPSYIIHCVEHAAT